MISGNRSLQALQAGSHGGSKSSLHLLKSSKEGKLKRTPSKESIDSTASVESSIISAGNSGQFDQVLFRYTRLCLFPSKKSSLAHFFEFDSVIPFGNSAQFDQVLFRYTRLCLFPRKKSSLAHFFEFETVIPFGSINNNSPWLRCRCSIWCYQRSNLTLWRNKNFVKCFSIFAGLVIMLT